MASPCRGRMKLERSVSIALISTRASVAAHASRPAMPPPKAAYREPRPFALASASRSWRSPAGPRPEGAADVASLETAASMDSSLLSSGVSFDAGSLPSSCRALTAASDFPARALRTGVPVAGQPVGVHCSGCSGDGEPLPHSPQSTMSRCLRHFFFPSSMNSGSSLGIWNVFSSAMCSSVFLFFTPAKKSCRTCRPLETFISVASGTMPPAQPLKRALAVSWSFLASTSAPARCSRLTRTPAASMSVRSCPSGSQYSLYSSHMLETCFGRSKPLG
mmetsp:Transcript_16514/g.39168  ORF Transcript_16514/g.39168 Transcript_16514/m.39168 type:complete len:276 (-) Transcript_16514:865-1692(-)